MAKNANDNSFIVVDIERVASNANSNPMRNIESMFGGKERKHIAKNEK